MSNTSKAIPLGTIIGGFAMVIGQAVGNFLIGTVPDIQFDYTPLYIVGVVTSTSSGIGMVKRWKKQ